MTDPLIVALTAPGAPHEIEDIIVRGVAMRGFRHGPKTLAELYAAARQHGDRDFVVYGEERLNFDAFFARVGAMAALLQDRLGDTAGTHVAIAMRNRPDWMAAFVAITGLGGVAVLVNSRGTGPEMAAAIDDAECQLVIADTPRAAALRDAGLGADRLFDVDAGPLPEDRGFTPVAIDPDADAVIMFTTGTSGMPKGACLTHRSLTQGIATTIFSRAFVGAKAMAGMDPEVIKALSAIQPTVLNAFPLFHISGCASDFLNNLLVGGKVVIMQKWSGIDALDLIQRERVTGMSGSPAMLWDLVRVHEGKHDLSSLMALGIGGQALPPPLFADIRAMFPYAGFGVGFGQTETAGTVCAASTADLVQRPGTSGSVVPVAQVRIVDDEGRDLPAGEAGEIVIRAPMVARGYWNRPDETARVFSDGWVATGDVGYLDNENYLFVVDRKKDIIISGGENIACSEVEFAALAEPQVADAAAFGLPDDRMGERVVLAVAPKPGMTIDADGLKAAMAGKLAQHKVPTDIRVMAELPRNHMGKLDRKALRAAG
ncbi:Acyl-CoA synthetase (AMP-forming)/AMP-acid ligase II [Sphingomonas laterariae]|uniref:Acyl-CoA synthetase (AMP-forming)/AMP-acid ligase II n=1 Tax=Edaphosphingomonas laterariae TaxID=861865 RepID=A0A239HG79_9SPHN|nr:class I adenylate-forming enzyme family protein [Sphingomonas laterariae]SNS80302.1 Acyl-CoA synthetase (AMP-forming)/AMP-acid ligase II [Sphingomonas laterariae]